MTESKSAQGASKEHPRVILFSEKADLILAFSGDPDDKNHDLEVITFNPKTKEFEFRLIKFPDDWSTGQASSKNTDIVLSPKSCISCHKNPPRPNWEPYPFWPGSNIENNVVILPRKEKEYLEDFEQRAKDHPLYKYLDTEKNLELNYDFPLTNFLNKQLNLLNSERIAEYIKKSPDYQKFKYAIIAALLDCPDIPSYIPRNYDFPRSGDWRRLFEDTKRGFSKLHPKHKPSDDETARIATNLRYLLESRGITMNNWTLSFTADKYLLEISPKLLVPGIISELSKSDSDLLNKDCSQLREKSRRAFGNQ